MLVSQNSFQHMNDMMPQFQWKHEPIGQGILTESNCVARKLPASDKHDK